MISGGKAKFMIGCCIEHPIKGGGDGGAEGERTTRKKLLIDSCGSQGGGGGGLAAGRGVEGEGATRKKKYHSSIPVGKIKSGFCWLRCKIVR